MFDESVFIDDLRKQRDDRLQSLHEQYKKLYSTALSGVLHDKYFELETRAKNLERYQDEMQRTQEYYDKLIDHLRQKHQAARNQQQVPYIPQPNSQSMNEVLKDYFADKKPPSKARESAAKKRIKTILKGFL